MPGNAPHLTILMATRNGAAHLPAQLDSLLAQMHPHWSLLISDDNSSDETGAILSAFQTNHASAHDIRILRGPGRGATANFLHLLAKAPTDAPVALCDQDDVWHPNKLLRALDLMGDGIAPHAPPLAYSAQSIITDVDLRPIGRTRIPMSAQSLHNGLLQNTMVGHGMVLNPAALRLLQAAEAVDVPFHDWWISQIMAATGSRVIIDHAATTLYRQHGRNVIGSRQGMTARLARAGQLVNRDYGRWLRANVAALLANASLLTPRAMALIAATQDALSRPGPVRARAIAGLGLHRQTRGETAAVLAAMALGRI